MICRCVGFKDMARPDKKLADKKLPVKELNESEISEIIEMALSDHTAFAQIEQLYGLREKEVKALMRSQLKTGSYQAWRKRVRQFSDRRAHYK